MQDPTTMVKLRLGLAAVGGVCLLASALLPNTAAVVLHPTTGYPNFMVRGLFRTKFYTVGDIVAAAEEQTAARA